MSSAHQNPPEIGGPINSLSGREWLIFLGVLLFAVGVGAGVGGTAYLLYGAPDQLSVYLKGGAMAGGLVIVWPTILTAFADLIEGKPIMRALRVGIVGGLAALLSLVAALVTLSVWNAAENAEGVGSYGLGALALLSTIATGYLWWRLNRGVARINDL